MEPTVRGNNSSISVIPGNTESVLNKASSSAHAAVDSLAGAADGALDKVKPAIERVAAVAHHTLDKVAGVAAPAADWLIVQRDSLKAAPRKLVANTCDYVTANPLTALAIAVVSGFVLGRFIRR